MRLSSFTNKRTSLPALLNDRTSQPPNPSTSNFNFSILVELRRLHQTRYAAEGVRTRDVAGTNGPEESVRRRLIRELNALLRQEGSRATGTGQDRKLRWCAPAQDGTGLTPESPSVPAPTGNSANAAVVAQLRANKVSSRYTSMLPPNTNGCLGPRIPAGEVSSCRGTALQPSSDCPSFSPLPYRRWPVFVGFY